jgi:hypothetical protein
LAHEQGTKQDHILSANARIELGKNEMGDNISLALQVNCDQVVVDDKAFALLGMAKEFDDDAADLKDLMAARAVKMKLKLATFEIGCLGSTALPLINLFII